MGTRFGCDLADLGWENPVIAGFVTVTSKEAGLPEIRVPNNVYRPNVLPLLNYAFPMKTPDEYQ